MEMPDDRSQAVDGVLLILLVAITIWAVWWGVQ